MRKKMDSSSFDGGNDRITSCRMWGQQEFGQHKGRFCADNSIEPKVKQEIVHPI